MIKPFIYVWEAWVEGLWQQITMTPSLSHPACHPTTSLSLALSVISHHSPCSGSVFEFFFYNTLFLVK
jgi:hypothetical protein